MFLLFRLVWVCSLLRLRLPVAFVFLFVCFSLVLCFVIVYTGGWFSVVLFASIWLGKLLFWGCVSNYGLEFSDFRLVVLFGYSSVVSVGLRALWFACLEMCLCLVFWCLIYFRLIVLWFVVMCFVFGWFDALGWIWAFSVDIDRIFRI